MAPASLTLYDDNTLLLWHLSLHLVKEGTHEYDLGPSAMETILHAANSSVMFIVIESSNHNCAIFAMLCVLHT